MTHTDELMTAREEVVKSGFDRRMTDEIHEMLGLTPRTEEILTEGQKGFLLECATQSLMQHRERVETDRMTEAQRKMKSELLRGLRLGFERLRFLEEPYRQADGWPTVSVERAGWLRSKDVQSVFDLRTFEWLVDFCLRVGGSVYQLPAYRALEKAFAREGYQIVLQLRGPPDAGRKAVRSKKRMKTTADEEP